MAKITDIIVSKETVSDDSYKVTSVLYNDGALVKKGDIIGSFETSKADVDVESPVDGYVFFNCKIDKSVIVGSIFASISESDTIPEDYFKSISVAETIDNSASKVKETGSLRISKPAEKLMREHKIDSSVFEGKSMIEKKDVEDYLAGGAAKSLSPEAGGSKTNKVIIIGGGNHTKVCIDILRQTRTHEIAGIVYTKTNPGKDLMGCAFIGGLNDLEKIYKNVATNAVIGIGGLENPQERAALYDRLKEIGFAIPNLIHPRAMIEPSVIFGDGNQFFAGANVGSCAKVGNNCILNSNSVVSHDCNIGNNVHITPGAILAGTVKVGNNSIIGMGVTVYYNCTIGQNVIITNGHHIFKDIPDNSLIR